MAEDWAANVRTYVPDADDAVIAGIVRYCGIALRNRDSSLVSMTDPVETGRVRDKFLKKKLGLALPDEALDAAIAEVGQVMRQENFKNRVTVYYLLADKFGALDLFRKGSKAKAEAEETVPDGAPHHDHTLGETLSAVGHAAGAVAGAAVGAFAGSGMGAGAVAGSEAAELVTEEVAPDLADRAHDADGPQILASPAPHASDMSQALADPASSFWKWLFWLLVALIVLAALWWLFGR